MIVISAIQKRLPFEELIPSNSDLELTNGQRNYLLESDEPIHSWYRFVLSYPPHLVREYIGKLDLGNGKTILDPFCGTGTTLVEARLCDLTSVGIEANPVVHMMSKAKLAWDIDPEEMVTTAQTTAHAVNKELERQGIDDLWPADPGQYLGELLRLPPETERLLIKNSISDIPLHKALLLRNEIGRTMKSSPFYEHALVALAKTLVFSSSNLRFGPEVGVGKIKRDAPVIAPWLEAVQRIAEDLKSLPKKDYPVAKAILGDSRDIASLIPANSIDAIITSPPYPNEKDYSRTTRLESVVLGFMTDKAEMRYIKKQLLRSNTRGVYKVDTDDLWASNYPEVVRLAQEIEQRRIDLNKTSGFERLYERVTRLYFGGMAKHLHDLQMVLKPNARLAYVVGDQASYLQVMIRTGEILASIAENLGYEVEGIDLFRTRLATATGEQLREEVLLLKWPGRG